MAFGLICQFGRAVGNALHAFRVENNQIHPRGWGKFNSEPRNALHAFPAISLTIRNPAGNPECNLQKLYYL